MSAAKTAPVIVAHTAATTPGSAASGVKNYRASAEARPEFCVATSMAAVRAATSRWRAAWARK